MQLINNENYSENDQSLYLNQKNSVKYQRGSSFDAMTKELDIKIRRSHDALKQINQKINDNESLTNISKNNISTKTDVILPHICFLYKTYI